jgi:hypothetical protein
MTFSKPVFASLALLFAGLSMSGSSIASRGVTTVATPNFQLVSFDAEDSQPDDIFEVFRSTDTINWTKLSPSYDCLDHVRDPSIMKYNGTYYLIHTQSCSSGATDADIAWSQSADGVTWADHTQIDLGADIPGTQEAWAPEWFIDPNGSGLSAVHFFLAVTTDPDQVGFQIYEKHPTGISGTTFTGWSTAQAITISETGSFNPIDPFVVFRSDTNLYYLWWKQNLDGQEFINYGSSSTLLGTYTPIQTNTDWAGWGIAEGPCLLKTSTGWRIFFDNDNNSLTAGQINYSDATGNDWSTWTTKAPIVTSTQAKHGTVIPYP